MYPPVTHFSGSCSLLDVLGKEKKKKGRGESVLNNSGRLERQLEGMQNEGTGSAPQREARGESRTTIVKMKEMDVSERNRDIKQQ